MTDRQPVQIVEVDVDYCQLTYQTSAFCFAVLGLTGNRKCFNTFGTCQSQENFFPATKTLRFSRGEGGMPVGGSPIFPCIESVSAQSSTVNIAGLDERLSSFGRRATLDVTFRDFPYHDRFVDKYAEERRTGAAQADGVGYDPGEVGTFFAKLLARWPHYPNRSVRLIDGYLDGGVLTVTRTRHFVITDFEKDRNDRYTLRARDPLDLAANKKALAPKPTDGRLLNAITAGATSAILTPTGIGKTYPTSGRLLIGDELVTFTRSTLTPDNLNLISRGMFKTGAQDHEADDAVQVVYWADRKRVDVVVRELLVTYAGINPAFIPTAAWASEVDRWARSRVLSFNILKPEGVEKLLAEISVLGFMIWWDDTTQTVGLKAVRPPDGDTVFFLTDRNAIKSLKVTERADDRLTEVIFNHKLRKATDSHTDPKSYERSRYVIDVLSKLPEAYGDTRVREINCRLLEHGSDFTARQSARRIVNRMKKPPARYNLLVDNKDDAIGLTDVIDASSRSLQDDTGREVATRMQVIKREEVRAGHEFEIEAIRYEFVGRLAYVAPSVVTIDPEGELEIDGQRLMIDGQEIDLDGQPRTIETPDYMEATTAMRKAFAFVVDATTLRFPDNSGPYEVI